MKFYGNDNDTFVEILGNYYLIQSVDFWEENQWEKIDELPANAEPISSLDAVDVPNDLLGSIDWPQYQVDEAMLGQEWRGESEGVKEFCEILQDVVGVEIEIVPITDSCNGANNDDDDIVTESQWLTAIDRDCNENPYHWQPKDLNFFGLQKHGDRITADEGRTFLKPFFEMTTEEFEELVFDIECWRDETLSDNDISDLIKILS